MTDQRRGKNIAIAGGGLQLTFAVVMLAVGFWTDSAAARACAVFVAGGVGLWLMVALLFYVRQLQRQEEIELEELTAGRGSDRSIFKEELELRPAKARAEWIDRWLVPLFTFLWAGYHAATGILLIRFVSWGPLGESANYAPAALFALIVGFLSFLFSRYTIGMGLQPQWRLLRATGSYLFVCCLAIAAVAGSLLAAYQGYLRLDSVVAFFLPLIQLVLAAELVLNLVLDLYRPRVPGEEYRPSFDSRLFNLAADPGRIGHSIAEALNYQFGFEVSKTWFYQLVSKAFVPLVLFGAAVLVGMTGLVIVRDGEECVVLHWGRPDPARATLKPGAHLKWPWPIDSVKRFKVDAVHEVILGAGRERTAEERKKEIVPAGTFAGRELYLWTQEHGRREELDFLVAIPPELRERSGPQEEKRPPVSIIKLVVQVQYVITDVYKYGFQVADAEALLEAEAYRQMVRYAASATLDSPVGGHERDRPEAIMTYGRVAAAEALERRIQEAVDLLDLGVRITHVGILAVHPPAEAAPAFEEVLKAEREMDQKRYEAEAEANELLAKVAGDPVSALSLALAIRTQQELWSLSQLRGEPVEMQRAIDGYVRAAREDADSLREEIRRERMLGQRAAAKEELLGEHLAHVALLESLRKGWREFDFDAEIAASGARADKLFGQATGEPARLVAQASAYRWEKELAERARSEAFDSELLAYQASPRIYRLDRWLDVWDEVLPGITKYVLGVSQEKVRVWLNLERGAEVLETVSFEESQASE